MPQPKRPLKVFLCHAHADRDAVRALYSRLTNDGVDAWLDKEKLLPGQDWELEIKKAVRAADVVVVCLSKQFNQAGFRQKEVRLALDTAMEKPEGEIFIIPARLEECDNLESLRKWHWVDLFEDDGYEMLMRALRARANKINATLQIKSKRTSNNLTNSQNVKLQTNGAMNTRAVLSAMALVFILLSFTLIPFLGNLNWGKNDKLVSEIVLSSTPSVVSPTITLTKENINLSLTPAQIDEVTTTATALQTEIMDAKGVTMRLVPAGEFMMGSDNGKLDEQPVHRVILDAYYMDVYEVTNALYSNCVATGVCTKPSRSPDSNNVLSYDDPLYSNYPVVYVSWYQAQTYCEWRDADLPTEAEWEKAARGTESQTYPWGEGIDCSFSNFNLCIGWDDRGIATTAIGNYEKGGSPYKIYDMAGNVWEWVGDFYEKNYYENSTLENPQGPNIGQFRVIRGGSYYDNSDYVRAANRDSKNPNTAIAQIGFRCAVNVTSLLSNNETSKLPPITPTLDILLSPTMTEVFSTYCSWKSSSKYGSQEDSCTCNSSKCACYYDNDPSDGFNSISSNYYTASRTWIEERIQEYGGKCN